MLYIVYLVVAYQSNTSINSQLLQIYLNDNGTKHYIHSTLVGFISRQQTLKFSALTTFCLENDII